MAGCVIMVNGFHNITIEFFFSTDQRLDPSFECKGKKGIFPRHVLVKFPDLLGLGSQEIVVL